MTYSKPSVSVLGSFDALTLSHITKTSGVGDVISINGVDTPVPGTGVITVS